jgi:MerR family transcriptional regulator, copper efflux regulator
LKVYAAFVTIGYKIKEVADRTGFSTATLRYYEDIGLLPQSARTASGYRIYDERTVERLAFISRAKQLGCTLDEIADLTLAFDGGQCGPIQDRLRTIVAAKIATTREQIVDLMTLSADLQQAAASLELHRPDGPCDDTCGCVTPGSEATSVQLVAKPAIACTLAGSMMPGRLDDWRRLLAFVSRREAIDGGMRLTFTPEVSSGSLMDLVAAEQECCRFFSFAITVDERGLALEVRAPAEAESLVTTLFGSVR